MPSIGRWADLWAELVEVKLSLPKPETAAEIDTFMDSLGPVILLHTRGNTGTERKNCSMEQEADIYKELLRATDCTIITCDWDNRVHRIPHRRVRHLLDFRHVNILELAYMMSKASLFIGVDSGPLHLTRFTNCPAVGIWYGHHPAHYALPRANTVHIVPDHFGVWNRARRHSFHIVDVPKITGEQVAKTALRMMKEKSGRECVIHHMIDKVRTSTSGGVHDRDVTFSHVVNHLRKKHKPVMVETGCSRVRYTEWDDWTAGHSTYLFGMVIDGLGGSLNSVDISADHVAIAKEWCAPFPCVSVHHSDSRAWLAQNTGPAIDVAYLDSADVGTDAYQEICLDEARSVIPHMATDGMILIDDSFYTCGKWDGKGGKAIPWLCENGWQIIYSGWQTLLSKPQNRMLEAARKFWSMPSNLR